MLCRYLLVEADAAEGCVENGDLFFVIMAATVLLALEISKILVISGLFVFICNFSEKYISKKCSIGIQYDYSKIRRVNMHKAVPLLVLGQEHAQDHSQ